MNEYKYRIPLFGPNYSNIRIVRRIRTHSGSDVRTSAELITIFSGASNHLFAMSVAFSSQWRVTGKGMLQSTVETGLWTKMLNEDLHSSLCRNYECPHCHKKFSRSYYLTDHLKVKLSNWNRKINQNISDPLPWKALHLWHLW